MILTFCLAPIIGQIFTIDMGMLGVIPCE